MPPPLFEVTDLRIAVFGGHRPFTGEPAAGLPAGWVVVVPGVSFSVAAGETLALVGESASGKSLMLLGSVGLLAQGARLVGGGATLEGVEVALDDARRAPRKGRRWRRFVAPQPDHEEWRRTLGTRVGVLFQDHGIHHSLLCGKNVEFPIQALDKQVLTWVDPTRVVILSPWRRIYAQVDDATARLDPSFHLCLSLVEWLRITMVPWTSPTCSSLMIHPTSTEK